MAGPAKRAAEVSAADARMTIMRMVRLRFDRKSGRWGATGTERNHIFVQRGMSIMQCTIAQHRNCRAGISTRLQAWNAVDPDDRHAFRANEINFISHLFKQNSKTHEMEFDGSSIVWR